SGRESSRLPTRITSKSRWKRSGRRWNFCVFFCCFKRAPCGERQLRMKSQLRLGIIGAGSVVREIYQYLYFRSAYSPMLQVCAVADPNTEYRNWFGDLAALPANRRYTDYQTMLQEVELDAVQVNTPDHLHC